MLSNWAYFSLTIYASFYQLFETIALQWNKDNQTLVFISGTKRLRIWIFNTFLGAIVCHGCCIFLLIREIYAPSNSSLIFLIIQLFLCTGAFFWLFAALSCFHYGEDFVVAWNYIKRKSQQIALCKTGEIIKMIPKLKLT